MVIKNVLENFMDDKDLSKNVEFIKEIPPKKGRYGYLNDLNPLLIDYLNSKNIKLYEHQCQVTNFIRQGKNVIITTPTASGKTFAFTLPVLEKFADNKQATALYLYPAKALSNDQLSKFKKYEKETKIQLDPYVYDGDTKKKNRPFIRSRVRTLISNPHMLHLILGWHEKWARFYSNLKYVILDEAHVYRGVFGSNVALLLRRMERICSYYGSDPQYILSSATLDNPIEFSEKLVGKKFELVSDDYSASGKKSFVFYNPYKTTEEPSITRDTRSILSMLLLNDLQTLCFTRTKAKAETVADNTKKYLKTQEKKFLNEENEYMPLWKRIVPYRAQYRPHIRRAIEYGLKSRKCLGVVTTNALELGIDIGSLDAVIISSYPGTLISTWQQAGRAGRKDKESLVVLLAEKDPLNQYIIKNPRYFLDASHEKAVVDLSNEYVNFNHIRCAASEIPITMDEIQKYFPFNKSTDYLEKLGLKNVNNKWEYMGNNPAKEFQLKKFSGEEFKIIYESPKDSKKYREEKISKEEAYLLAYPEATHKYMGTTYVIKNLDLNKKIIKMKKQKVDSHFSSMKKYNLKVLNTIKTKKMGLLTIYFGKLEINTEFLKYNSYKGKRDNYEKIDVPDITFTTKGMWINIPDSILHDLKLFFKMEDYEEILKESISGLAHSITAMFPIYVLCDRCDINGVSTPYHEDTQNASIFIYDSHEGGIGLSERGLEFFKDLISLTLDMVQKCNCKDGCGHCIHSSLCNVDPKPRSKLGTIFLLKKLLECCEEPSNLQIPISSIESKDFEKSNDFNKDSQLQLSVLLNDNYKTKRAHAAYVLGEIGDPEFVDDLCKATKDVDGNVRRLSASALGKIGDKRAKSALVKLLKDEKPQVRQYAAKALGKIGSKK